MAEKKYRVAVVGGAGTWGRHYLRTYAAHPNCEIVGLADRARERRQAFAQRYGVVATYDRVEDLLAEVVPDVVSAIVPVAHNYAVVRACVEAGVRVVSCEKPISAQLSEADAMVALCRERGTLLGCGQTAWAAPRMPEVVQWVRDGNIGRLTAAAIPGGLPVEVSGGGCVQLAAMRILTGMEVEWAEGWELPPVPGYAAPGTPAVEVDVPMYGRLGLSGGIVCDIVRPPEHHIACVVSAAGENGQVWLAQPEPVLIQGAGPAAVPVHLDSTDQGYADFFVPTIQRLLDAFDTGVEPASSGHDLRQSLEIAIALKLSAANGHARVHLPLPDRSHRLLPHPYRLHGGDVAGWQSIGYDGPPQVPAELGKLTSFEQIASLPRHDLELLLREVEAADLIVALLGSSQMLQKRIFWTVTDRIGGYLRKGMAAEAGTPPAETEAARARILEIARRL